MAEATRVVFTIRGLPCASCALDAARALRRAVPGVLDANINYVVDRGYVEFDPEQVTWERVAAALTARGYTAVPVR